MATEFDAVFGVKDRSLWDLHLADPESDSTSGPTGRQYLLYKFIKYWDKFNHKIDLSHSQDQYRVSEVEGQGCHFLKHLFLKKQICLKISDFFLKKWLCFFTKNCIFRKLLVAPLFGECDLKMRVA